MIPDNELLQHEVCALGNHHFLCPLAVGSWQDLTITIPMVWDHSKKIQCQRVSDVKQEKRESKMHTHTSFKCPSIYKPGSVDCTTLMSMMSWELYRSTPPWLEVSRTSWSSFNKCLHPSTASRFGVSASLAKNHQNPTLFVKNLRPLKKHLQDHKSSLDFVFSNKQLDGFDACVCCPSITITCLYFFTPW